MPDSTKQASQHWQSDFYKNSPIFAPLYPVVENWSNQFRQWPTLDDYQHLLHSHAPDLCSHHGAEITFVAQAGKPQAFDQGYEQRIFLTGEVQTRIQNWHDFFQVLMWSSLPQTKSLINALHYQASYQRVGQHGSSHRNAMENLLTQFDECGAILLSSNPDLLQLVTDHQWPELFQGQRDILNKHFACFVFGHALYEKALNPYVGMTAHCLCLKVPQDFFQLPMKQQLQKLDQRLGREFQRGNLQRARDLQPFPLLGMPDWYHRQTESFYQDTRYFRPRRSRSSDRTPK